MKGMIYSMNNTEGFLIVESSSIAAVPQVVSNTEHTVTISAILQEAEVPNRNRRIYSRDALYNSLNGPIVQEKIKNKTFYGKHPCPSLQ